MVASGGRGRFRAFGVARNAGRPTRSSTATIPETPIATASTSVVTVSPASVATGNDATTTLTVNDQNGLPMSGVSAARLGASATGSNNTIASFSGSTDSNGQITTTISSTTAEAKTISCTVDSVTVTDTAALTVTAAAALVFESLWDTSAGDTNAAVQNTSAATPWELRVGGAGNGMQVVNAASEGVDTNCPTTNALRVDLVYVGGTIQNMDTDAVLLLAGSGAWSIPAVGESVWFAVNKRVAYPHVADPPALGTNNHSCEQGPGSNNSWSWNFNTGSAGWNPSFNVWVASSPTRFLLGGASPVYLDRNKWYRLEWRIHRTDTNLREHEIRIYDEANPTTILYDETDFTTSGGTTLSGYSAAFGTNGVAALDAWDLGTNGPNVVGATVGCAPAWYFAAARASRTEWCGPHTP